MDKTPTQSRGSLSFLFSKPPASRAKCAPHSSCRLHLHVYQVTAYLEMPFCGSNISPVWSQHSPRSQSTTSMIYSKSNRMYLKKEKWSDWWDTDCQEFSCGFLCPPRSCLWHWFPSSLVTDFPKFSWVWKYFLHSAQYVIVLSCLPALDIHSFTDRKCSLLHLLQGLSRWHYQTSCDPVDIFQPTARS